MKKTRRKKPLGHETEIILLRDLAPPSDVTGGAGKILFGERLDDGRGGVNGPRNEQAIEGRSKRKS